MDSIVAQLVSVSAFLHSLDPKATLPSLRRAQRADLREGIRFPNPRRGFPHSPQVLHLICESSGPFFKQSKKWQTSRATGHLFLLFFFLFSFFLLITLGFFLLFPLAFVFFSLITHICFSLFEPGFPRWLLPTPLFDVRASRQPPGKRVPRQLPCPLLVKQSF